MDQKYVQNSGLVKIRKQEGDNHNKKRKKKAMEKDLERAKV